MRENGNNKDDLMWYDMEKKIRKFIFVNPYTNLHIKIYHLGNGRMHKIIKVMQW